MQWEDNPELAAGYAEGLGKYTEIPSKKAEVDYFDVGHVQNG